MRFLVLALLLTSSCASSDPSPETIRCKEMAAHPLKGVVPARSVDWVAILRVGFDPSVPEQSVVDQIGDRCSTASDRTGCIGMVASLGRGTGWITDSTIETMVATVKDDVISYQSPKDLLRFLGPVDSQEKAALLVRSSGRELACDVAPVTDTAGGYRMTTHHFSCQETLRVTNAGEIVVEAAQMQGGEGPCPMLVDAGFVDTGLVFDSEGFDAGDFDTGAPTSLDSTTLDSAAPEDAPAVDGASE
jgi:hypothetical protein